VTVRQPDNESTTVELKLDTTDMRAYREYYIVASNKYGTAVHVVSLLQDPAYQQAMAEVRSSASINHVSAWCLSGGLQLFILQFVRGRNFEYFLTVVLSIFVHKLLSCSSS